MNTRSKVWLVISALLTLSLVLSACGTPTPEVIEREVERVVTQIVEIPGETIVETQVVEREVEVVVTPEPVRTDRTGAWLDTIVVVEEPSADAAINRLEVGDIDVYAFQVTNPEIRRRIEASDTVEYVRSSGSYSELTFNPAGPEFENGNLNPFAVPAIREAMHWVIDRAYIAEEIHGGMAIPRWTPFNTASSDYAMHADIARALELNYAYDFERGQAVINEEMEALGASLVNGVWNYNGAPVEIIVLIRTEDERRDIGDYVANVMEDLGFVATRDYKIAADASPIWMNGEPSTGQFHIYTGGWITTVVPRDLAGNFAFFYTDTGLATPLWAAYVNDPEFYDVAVRLDNSDFRDMAERREMISQALELSMQDNIRMFLIDRQSITPKRTEVQVAVDLYGGISGSTIWPYTIRKAGEVGGSMTIAMPSILTEPWNPLNGSNWIYDMMLIRGTSDMATNTDPFTGNWIPNRIERAEVMIEEGLPVSVESDWVTLEFVPTIEVPDDAWVDWDAAEQRFITFGELPEIAATLEGDALEAFTNRYGEDFQARGTAVRKSTVYYPADLYEWVTWHDGSPFSAADVVMAMILSFDRAKPESANYDAAQVAAFNSFMSAFKGVKIVSTDPLVIETYSDLYQLDAERSINTWWPYYAQGQGAWHQIAIGLFAEEDGQAAFSAAKSTADEVEYLSYIAGPTIESLTAQLTESAETGRIPFEATLGEFLGADEAATRYANYQDFFRRRGHYWIGTGAYYLERAFPVEGNVILRRSADFKDPADRWDRWATAPIAEAEIDGPGRVTIGDEATFDVFVELEGAPYPVADIVSITYMVFDATGQLAEVGQAAAVEDGLWEVTLSSELTSGLEAGSNRLEVVVVSSRVALPTFEAFSFVTAP
jgi:peptide/nickel transport system substrate-binding protein